MDRSVEMRLRLNIADFQRGTREASRDMDSLIARAAALDAALDRVNASSTNAAAGLRDARTQTRGMGRDADRAAPGITAAQAALDAFNNSAATASNNAAAVSRGTSGMSRGMTQAGNSARSSSAGFDQSGRSINQLTGRIGLAIDAVLTLGAAAVPIGAVAAQAAGGLAAMGAAAVIAGGSAVVAFQGVADAVEAVQKFQDDPTWDNARAAHEELDKMSSSARQFVMQYQRMRPVLSDLQDAAADGWFPGLTKSLRDLDDLAPKLEEILLKTGTVGGDLVAQSTESLAGPRWEEFYGFLADEVPTAMSSLFRIMGDLGHGAAQMWMAFDPGNDAFIDWVEGVASGFDQWASSADGRQDIADFLAYARESGPQVGAFFAALGDALISIVQAAAPLGGPTLAALTAVLEVVGAIAGSDMATPLLAAVAAMRLMSRAQALVTSGQGRLNAAMATTTRSTTALTRAQAAALNGSGLTGTALGAALVAPRAGDVRRQQEEQRRARLGMGAQAIGVGLLASGAASEIGLTNTAMLTLAGSMAGPVGAALGAVAGLSMDAAAANDDLTDSLKAAGAAISSGDFASSVTAMTDAQSKLADFKKDMDPNDWSNGLDLGFYKNTIEGWLGDSDVEEGEAAYAKLEAQMRSNQEAAAGLGEAFGLAMGPLDNSARSVQQLQAALEMAKPAMDALGISQEELTAAQRNQALIAQGGILGAGAEALEGSTTPYDDMVEAIRRKAEAMDSAAGRAENYRAVLHSLATDTGTAADQADRLREALDAMTDPALNAEAALSAQRDVLKEISELNADAGFTQKTEVGRANLETTRSYTEAVKERLATMVEAERSEADVARALQTSREQFIASGIAAGFSREQMRRRADEIRLTPALVETTFRELGITEVQRKTWTLRDAIQAMPKEKATAFRAEGIPKTKAEVDVLVAKYKLTEEQRQALITLRDQASAGIRNVQGLLNSVNGNRADTYIYTHHVQVNSTRNAGMVAEGSAGTGGVRKADGGLVLGPGGPRDDRIAAWLSNREYVQQAAAVDYYGVGVMDAINARRIPRDLISGDLGLAPRFARGGAVASAQPFGATQDVLTMGTGGRGPRGPRDVLTITSDSNSPEMRFLGWLLDASKKELRQRQAILKNELKRDERAIRREEREVQVAKQRVDLLQQESDALRDGLEARTKSDLFDPNRVSNKFDEAAWAFGGKPEGFDSWDSEMQQAAIDRQRRLFEAEQKKNAAANDPIAILNQDIREGAELQQLIKTLDGRGLDGDALDELLLSASLEEIREFAQGSQTRLDEYERLYKMREQIGMSVGIAGARADGVTLELQGARAELQLQTGQLKEARAEAKETNRRLAQIERRFEQLEKNTKDAPERTGKAVGAEIKSAVVDGNGGRAPR